MKSLARLTLVSAIALAFSSSPSVAQDLVLDPENISVNPGLGRWDGDCRISFDLLCPSIDVGGGIEGQCSGSLTEADSPVFDASVAVASPRPPVLVKVSYTHYTTKSYWNYACSATITSYATGSGLFVREVALETDPNVDGVYEKVDTCRYDGVFILSCTAQSTIKNQAVKSGSGHGRSRPSSAEICVDGVARGTNSFDSAIVPVDLTSVGEYFPDRLCTTVPVDYSDATGFLLGLSNFAPNI